MVIMIFLRMILVRNIILFKLVSNVTIYFTFLFKLSQASIALMMRRRILLILNMETTTSSNILKDTGKGD